MFLRVQNLTKRYGRTVAIDDANFEIKEGELITVLGPSGCGKTSILKAIGGFLKLDSGTIHLDGVDITGIPPEEREVSTVFQSYGLFPRMRVYENVQYGLKFRGIKRADRKKMAYQMLERVQLKGEEMKYPSQLSGGQRQRVALARSLIIKPRLLLLDEPLSNLDAKLRVEMRKQIKNLQKDFRITMLFVTHDQTEAFTLSDRILLMNEGKIVQTATPKELYRNPVSNFSLDFIGESNLKDGNYCRLEDIKLSEAGEELVVTDKEFTGDFIIYELQEQDGNILRAKTLVSREELEIGQSYKFKIDWKQAY